MKNKIIDQINNPLQLERLFRENKTKFKKHFNEISPNYKEHTSLQIWNERLNYKNDEISLGRKNEILALVILIIISSIQPG